MPDHLPGVTVVVPTLNRESHLLATVRDLLAQTHRPLEILIVDQSDTVGPELEVLVARHTDIVTHRRVTFRGLPIARNYGWQVARHDLILYVDDDIRCGPDLVRGHAEALTSGRAEICGGAIDGAMDDVDGGPGRYERWRAIPKTGFGSTVVTPVDHARGCHFSARRDVLRSVGGFDERLNLGAALHEETELMLRAGEAGARVMFDGRLRLTHLEASAGGTRQPDYRRYVHALAHNRSILIRRYSRWYQWSVGLGWSGKLMVAYTLHAREPGVLLAGLRGMARGWRAGGAPPVCTSFGRDHP